ncbi:MAG: hypothetical protein MZV70_53755 [Desulfobacterales bacterium]|nr:hypothetical protein [Desulfobacterales bacterium]
MAPVFLVPGRRRAMTAWSSGSNPMRLVRAWTDGARFGRWSGPSRKACR